MSVATSHPRSFAGGSFGSWLLKVRFPSGRLSIHNVETVPRRMVASSILKFVHLELHKGPEDSTARRMPSPR